MKLLRWFTDVDNRLYYHIFFWVVYYVYRVMIYGDVVNTYENVAYVQFLELPAKIGAVYVNLYVLMPRFLKKKKNLVYSILLVLTLGVATLFQREIIRWCMQIGIYDPMPMSKLYSSRRFIVIGWHIVNILVITSLIKIVKDRYQGQKTTHALVKEKLQTELKFLKAQINPHFLFNTLNSLYSLSLHQSPQTPEAILKLSHLMSYMLYETGQKEVPLDKEIACLQDYISLEKLRSGDYVEVKFTVSGHTKDIMIAPALLLPFIENSFKHVAESDAGKGWIHIHIEVKNDKLRLNVENSADVTTRADEIGKAGGVGLSNVRRRLELLYKDHYQLVSLWKPNSYLVTLQLDVKENPALKPLET